MIETDMHKPGLYTVMVFNKYDECVGMAEDVLAWTRREAYFSVMNEMAPHKIWDAWRDENLEQWPDDEPAFRLTLAAPDAGRPPRR